MRSFVEHEASEGLKQFLENVKGPGRAALFDPTPGVIDRTVYPGALRPRGHMMTRIFGGLRAIWSRPPL